MEENAKVPDDFIIFSRRLGELSEEEKTEIFHTINNSIELFLANYEGDKGDN